MSRMFLDLISKEHQDRFRSLLEEGWFLNKTCWEWNGKLDGCGYGVISRYRVHRLSYALFVSDFHLVSFICHKCDNPKCYNPVHLYEGDAKSNGKDAATRKRVKSYSIYKKVN